MKIEDFGDALNGDWSDIFEKMVAHFRSKAKGFRVYSMPLELGHTQSVYNLSRTLDISGLWIRSVRTDLTLQFHNKEGDGFVAHYPSPGNGRPGSSPEGYGGSPLLEGPLTIRGDRSGTGNGVHCFITIRAREIRVENWGGHGWLFDADARRPFPSNANRWRLDYCSAVNVGGSGLKLDGGDSNIGLSSQFNAAHCGEWGIHDSSFLSNLHEIPHQANSARGYKAEGLNQASLWLAPYNEGEVECDLDAQALAITPRSGRWSQRSHVLYSNRHGGLWVEFIPGTAIPRLWGDTLPPKIEGRYLEGTEFNFRFPKPGKPDRYRVVKSSTGVLTWEPK